MNKMESEKNQKRIDGFRAHTMMMMLNIHEVIYTQ